VSEYKYTYKGEALSNAEIAKRAGLSKSTALRMLKKGADLDNPKNSKKHPYFGEMKTAVEISKIEGVSPQTVRERIAKGSAEPGTNLRKRRRIEYKGALRSTHDIAELENVSYQVAAKFVRAVIKTKEDNATIVVIVNGEVTILSRSEAQRVRESIDKWLS